MDLVKILDTAEKVVTYTMAGACIATGTAGIIALFGNDLKEMAGKYYHYLLTKRDAKKDLIKEQFYKQ